MGRRPGDGKQTVPVTVKLSDGDGANVTDNGSVSVIAAEADVTREQFPFIFNLLRGHAINSHGLAPGQVSAGSARSKASAPHHQHQHQQQQQQQQQPARKPAAVSTCRQRPATPPGRGTHLCNVHVCLSVCSFFQMCTFLTVESCGVRQCRAHVSMAQKYTASDVYVYYYYYRYLYRKIQDQTSKQTNANANANTKCAVVEQVQ